MEDYLSEASELRWSSSSEDSTLQMYSPAMMADMLNVSVRSIRAWVRVGLLHPSKTVMKVPYFDYSVLTVANRLAHWMHQGLTARSLVKQLTALARMCSDGRLDVAAALPLSLDGGRLVLKQGALRLESSGQIQFSFDGDQEELEDQPVTLQFDSPKSSSVQAVDSERLVAMLDAALEAEEEDDLEAAASRYRGVLSEYGPNAEICFHLAEVLYRLADLGAARERYQMALELEPGLVEARANLGCVLAEIGQNELAIDAFRTALQQYPDYADVHFHLARLLDAQGHSGAAVEHWSRFMHLAPASPWADEAAARLAEPTSLLGEDSEWFSQSQTPSSTD
jgi:tetratricopeptide (TPR) repeat protein